MRKAQALLEYAVLITCFIAAVVGMQIYLKRGISGRFKEAMDSIGQQYDPKHADSDVTISLKSNTTTVSKMVGPEYNFQDDKENTYYLFEKEKGDLISRSFIIQETTFDETTEKTGFENVPAPKKKEGLWH